MDDTRATTESRLTFEGELLGRVGPEGRLALMRALGGVAAARDADELCAALVDRKVSSRSIERCTLARHDADRSSLVVMSARDRASGAGIPAGADHLMALALREETLVTNARPWRSAAGAEPLDCALPLRTPEGVVGVLGVRWAEPREPACAELSPADCAQLLLLGNYIGPVMQRLAASDAERDARAKAESCATRLRGTVRISRELAEAGLDERELLDRAARCIAEVFGGACLVRMLDGAGWESLAADEGDPILRAELERLGDLGSTSLRATLSRGRAAIMKRPHRAAGGRAPLRKSLPPRSVMSAPITTGGASSGVILVVRRSGVAFTEDERLLLDDVSYRVGLGLSAARAFGAQQAARESAEAATRGRDRVLSIVTHDLRAPLATVHLAASLLGEMDPEHEGFADAIQRIGRATTRMRRLVDDLLDLGQLESGALCVRQTPVSLARVLDETVDELCERARAATKTLARAAMERPLYVLGDFERLQQLLVNLVVNAIDHTPAGTQIVLGAVRDAERACVWVEDDGPGLEPEIREHLFEPHVRGARATVHGAGLGLWIAKGLVEAHGGALSVESTPGVGTRFLLSLPLAPGA